MSSARFLSPPFTYSHVIPLTARNWRRNMFILPLFANLFHSRHCRFSLFLFSLYSTYYRLSTTTWTSAIRRRLLTLLPGDFYTHRSYRRRHWSRSGGWYRCHSYLFHPQSQPGGVMGVSIMVGWISLFTSMLVQVFFAAMVRQYAKCLWTMQADYMRLNDSPNEGIWGWSWAVFIEGDWPWRSVLGRASSCRGGKKTGFDGWRM